MPFIVKNQDSENSLRIYMSEGRRAEIPAGGELDLLIPVGDYTRSEIAVSDIPFHIYEGNIIINNGNNDLTELSAIRFAYNAPNPDEKRDRSGKLRVHQTSRKLGLRICWTGKGDIPSDINDVGHGETTSLEYNINDSNPYTKYIDFNCIENESWLHEGYITWADSEMDRIKVDMVPRVVDYGTPGISTTLFNGSGLDDCSSSGTFSGSVSKRFRIQVDSVGATDTFKWSNDGGKTWESTSVNMTASAQILEEGIEVIFTATTGHTVDDYWDIKAIISNPTTYKLYNNYLIVPYSFPVGDIIDVITNLEDPILDNNDFGGLIYMPDDDLGNPPSSYWNADWNSTTNKFENVTPAPNGDGRYNIFGYEISLTRIFNDIPLLQSGFIAFNSSDTDQLGHGMRLKLVATTNTNTVPDHSWSVACTICMHRAKSV